MLSKLLLVGDPHVTADELTDATRLFDFVTAMAKQHEATVVLLGDLHHTFTLTNIKVTAFYKGVFGKMKEAGIVVRSLVGNHDMPGDGSGYPHALISYSDIQVVDKPVLLDSVLYVPYIADPNLFVSTCGNFPQAKTVICHQEIDGAKYDNGFYAPHGADPKQIKQQIISGHIHTQQRFANVWYPGAPRWRTVSDANQSRAIWLLELEDGLVVEKTPISTDEVCRRIMTKTITEEAPYDTFGSPEDDWRVTIEGDEAFVRSTVADIRAKMPWAKIKTMVNTKSIKVRESDGIPTAFKKYLAAFAPKYGTTVDRLTAAAVKEIYGTP